MCGTYTVDNGILDGNCDEVLQDLKLPILDEFLSAAPAFWVTAPKDVTLLGSSLGESNDSCISDKI